MTNRVKVPKAVLNAATRADEILKSLEPEVETSVEDVTPVEPPKDTENKIEITDNTGDVVKITPPSDKPAPATDDKLEHRIKTIQGMWDADKRRAQQITNELTAQINELRLKLTQAESSNKLPAQFDIRTYFSDDDLATYGNNLPQLMLKMVTQVANEVTESRVKTAVEPIQTSLKEVAERSHQESVNNFWKSLARAVPTWQAINADIDFHSWLNQREGFTKSTRQDILASAEKDLDVDTVIEMFKAFEQSRTVNKPQDVTQRVASKVLPESVTPVPNMNPSEPPPMFTASQIRKHYNDYARGVYRSRPEDWDKLEARINEAYRTNRVSQG